MDHTLSQALILRGSNDFRGIEEYLWDKDHDVRVIEVVEEMYYQGLLASSPAIGERKGAFSSIIDGSFLHSGLKAERQQYLHE